MARLGDLCRFINGDRGKNYPSQAEISVNGEIPFINAGHIVDGKLDFSEMNYISQKKFEQLNSGKIQENDILYCLRGSLGKKAIVKGIPMGAIASSLVIIRPDEQKLNSDYLFYALESPTVQEQMMQANNGSSQPNLSAKSVSDYTFNLPDLKEQLVVVSKLAKVNELISMRKEQLAKLDQLVKSRFVEQFIGKGYPIKTVDEVSLGKGEYGAQSASVEYDPRRPRYVRITDINEDGTLNDDFVASINPVDDEQYKLEYGDFMFARMGATVGKTYAFIEGNQIFAGYLIRYRLNKSLINPRYLFWYTKLYEYWNWVKLNQSGAAQPGINAKKYGSLQIPLPSIEEQDAFAAFVEQTDKSKLAIQQSLDKLELMKKSLMQEYFG